FNILPGRMELTGARVLDLFAGTGALGLEALRRGAAHAVFVEHDHALADAIRARGRKAALADRMEVWRKEALSAVRELGRSGRQFELIILDPPYGLRWIPRILQAVVAGAIAAPGGIIVAEGHWRDRPAVTGLALVREARYGDTVLWFFEQRGEEPAP
ncbi:MAG: RsmD family RNA methyltransferase, partial [bacterium]